MAAVSLNLAWLLEQQARLMGDRLAVICGESRLSYAQLDGMANQSAGGGARLFVYRAIRKP